MGLAFDDWDLDYYTRLFKDMGRDPTNVELFDIAQSNSEHSRHWFFKGDLVIDGDKKAHNLMDIVRAPLEVSLRAECWTFETMEKSACCRCTAALLLMAKARWLLRTKTAIQLACLEVGTCCFSRPASIEESVVAQMSSNWNRPHWLRPRRSEGSWCNKPANPVFGLSL